MQLCYIILSAQQGHEKQANGHYQAHNTKQARKRYFLHQNLGLLFTERHTIELKIHISRSWKTWPHTNRSTEQKYKIPDLWQTQKIRHKNICRGLNHNTCFRSKSETQTINGSMQKHRCQKLTVFRSMQ